MSVIVPGVYRKSDYNYALCKYSFGKFFLFWAFVTGFFQTCCAHKSDKNMR